MVDTALSYMVYALHRPREAAKNSSTNGQAIKGLPPYSLMAIGTFFSTLVHISRFFW